MPAIIMAVEYTVTRPLPTSLAGYDDGSPAQNDLTRLRWDRSGSNSYEVFLDGSNLGNRQARPHTSLLRDYAPLPGRGVAFGIRAWF